MKPQRLAQWSGSVLCPRTRPCHARVQVLSIQGRRSQTTVTEAVDEVDVDEASVAKDSGFQSISITKKAYASHKHYEHLKELPSPPISAALNSAKLSALHARLQLPSRLPLQTLAKCLVHRTADPDPRFNNSALEILGHNILGYYTSELILCTYPRLPMPITYAAMEAYVGPAACEAIAKEWGVEAAGEPGGEVDPGYLQFVREIAGNADLNNDGRLHKDVLAAERKRQKEEAGDEGTWDGLVAVSGGDGRTIRNSTNHASIYPTYFGRLDEEAAALQRHRADEQPAAVARATLQRASTAFVHALFGALYLHAGRAGAKRFFNQHVRPRKLDVSKMFYFKEPTRDLSRLCAREGYERPVGRILSETGRHSRHPVFMLGVFSGRHKLGEGSGASLDEARIRAAVSALKGWYRYSPLDPKVPSDVEGTNQPWKPGVVDGGEIII